MAKKPTIAKTVQWGRFVLTEAEIERQIGEATLRGEAELQTEPLATAARFDRRTRCVIITLNKGSTLSVPVDLLQGLAEATLKDLAQIEIPSPGCEIEWPTLDQQFSIQGLLAGRFGTRRWMAELAERTPSAAPHRKLESAKSNVADKKGRRRKPTAVAIV